MKSSLCPVLLPLHHTPPHPLQQRFIFRRCVLHSCPSRLYGSRVLRRRRASPSRQVFCSRRLFYLIKKNKNNASRMQSFWLSQRKPNHGRRRSSPGRTSDPDFRASDVSEIWSSPGSSRRIKTELRWKRATAERRQAFPP